MSEERVTPVDLRLYLPALACWLGTLLGLQLPASLAHRLGDGMTGHAVGVAGLVLSGVLGVAISAAHHSRSGRRLSVVLLTCALAGAGGGASRVIAAHAGPVPDWAGGRAVISGSLVVLTDPQRRERDSGPRSGTTYTVLRGRLEQVEARGQRARVRTPVVVIGDGAWAHLLPGQTLDIAGRLGPARPGGPEVAVLRVQGVPKVIAPAGLAYRMAEPFRRGLRQAMADRAPAPGGLVPALVIGDESGVDGRLRDDLATTGLTHLTAVSGANVAIIVAAVLGLARWTGIRAYGLPIVGVLAVAGFVVLARPQPSVIRAATMGLVAVAGLAAGSRQRGVAALGTAVLALLLLDPWLARSAGFTLSVLATGGILLLAPGWRDAATRWMPRALAEGLAVPLAAQVATLPVLIALTHTVSLVGLPANIIVAPAVAPATILGAAAAAVSPVAPWLAEAIGRVAVVPAGWIAFVAERGAVLPGAVAGWPPGWVGVAIGAATAVVLMVATPAILRQRASAAAIAVLALIVVIRPVHAGWPPAGWVLVACDVGQGDAVVLRTGADSALLIDVGPDPDAVDKCLRQLRIGVVPQVLLTHFHADHVEGLPGALRGREVGEIVVSPLDEPAEEAERVRRWAGMARVPVSVAAAGEQRAIGPVTWHVVWPRRLIRGEGSEPNNASVVLLVEVRGIRMLLAGDVEPAAQRAIHGSIADLAVDVLKVPHHGSVHQDPGFLEATDPSIALISVGAGNTYGHPAPSLVTSLTQGGARVFRTDLSGTVAVVQDGDHLGVVAR